MNLNSSEKSQLVAAVIADIVQFAAVVALSVYIGSVSKWYVGVASYVVISLILNSVVSKKSE